MEVFLKKIYENFVWTLETVRNSEVRTDRFVCMSKLRVPLSEPVSFHVKLELTTVLSAFHATPVNVPITDS